MDEVEKGYYEDTVNPYAQIRRDTEWGVFSIGSETPVERGLGRRQAADRADELNRQHNHPVENRED